MTAAVGANRTGSPLYIGSPFYKGLKVISDVIEGADVTTKLTKFIKSVVSVASIVFGKIAACWKDYGAVLGTFSDALDSLWVVVALKKLIDVAMNHAQGWQKNAANVCLATSRILTTVLFFDKIKVINFSYVAACIGSIPVLGTLSSVLACVGLSLLVVSNVNKLTTIEQNSQLYQAEIAFYDRIESNIQLLPNEAPINTNHFRIQAVDRGNDLEFNKDHLTPVLAAYKGRIQKLQAYVAAERRSTMMDAVDKVAKVVFIILGTMGMVVGCPFIAFTSSFMITFGLVTATISLGRVIHDKIWKVKPEPLACFKDQPRQGLVFDALQAQFNNNVANRPLAAVAA